MIRRWYPNFLCSDSPDVLAPNHYPYNKSNSGGSNYSNRLQKAFSPPMGVSRNRVEAEEVFGMKTYGWRGDLVTTGEV